MDATWNKNESYLLGPTYTKGIASYLSGSTSFIATAERTPGEMVAFTAQFSFNEITGTYSLENSYGTI